MLNVDGTIRLITEKSVGFSTGEWVAILVSIISLLGVLVTTITNNRTTLKINRENIDANLKAKARIEWIQKVRGTTAELSALYFRLLNEKDKEKILDIYTESQEKNGLLILFFGHEKKEKTDNRTLEEILFDQNSNDNKNDIIVNFLSELSNSYYDFYRKVMDDTLNRLEDIRKMRIDELYDTATEFEEFVFYDPDGNEYSHKHPMPSFEDDESLQEAKNNIREYAEFAKKLENGISYLRDIMRIYLKIEWNKAKKGE